MKFQLNILKYSMQNSRRLPNVICLQSFDWYKMDDKVEKFESDEKLSTVLRLPLGLTIELWYGWCF